MSQGGIWAGNTRIVELDGIRGLAVAMVLVWHFIPCCVEAAPGTALGRLMVALGMTWAGVDLFFVLSGFLIGGILYDKRASPRFFRTFYVRRACRILPPYLLLLGMVWLLALGCGMSGWLQQRLGWMFEKEMSASSYLLFVQNFHMAFAGHSGIAPLGVTWSLAIEEQFYLVTPLLVWLVSPRRLAFWFVLAAVFAAVFRIHVFRTWEHGGHAAYVMLVTRWDALFAGLLLSWAFRRPGAAAVLSSSALRKVSWAVLGLCLAVLAVLGLKMQLIASAGMSFGGYTVLALAGVALVTLAVTGNGGHWLRRGLRSPVLIWLGGISYTLYLQHELMLGLVHGLVKGEHPRIRDGADVLLSLLALALALLFSHFSWKWLERPMVRRGQQHLY